jgi:hypothetical protein
MLTSVDILEITNVLHKFIQCIDSGDAKTFESLFTDDSESELSTLQIFKKKSELKSFCLSIHEKFPNSQHFESNILIEEVSEGEVRNTSYWTALQSGTILSYGMHHDLLVKQGLHLEISFKKNYSQVEKKRKVVYQLQLKVSKAQCDIPDTTFLISCDPLSLE